MWVELTCRAALLSRKRRAKLFDLSDMSCLIIYVAERYDIEYLLISY